MSCPARSRQTVALCAAVATFALGCGQGLFDRGRYARDAAEAADGDPEPPSGLDVGPPIGPDGGPDAIPDAGPEAGPDAVPDLGSGGRADAGPDTPAVTKLVDQNGSEMILDQATLTIGPGTFQVPTRVTLREVPSIDHTGAYGPVFEVSVPAPGLFRQVAKLTLQVPLIGANQANLVLGTLDPSRSLAVQQWEWVSDSMLSSDQSSITGSVTGFGNATSVVLQYAAVLRCSLTSQCRSGEACNAGVCQQCPTSSVCAP